METGETFYLRAYPKGIIGAAMPTDLPEMCFIATRREMITGPIEVAFAILWSPESVLQNVESVESLTGSVVSAVGARGLHIVLPSLFNHHAVSTVQASRVFSLYDEFNYESIRPSTFTIHTPGANGTRVQRAGPGFSSWVLAGHLGGVAIQDMERRIVEDISSEKWAAKCGQYANELKNKCKTPQQAQMAIANAFAITDLLTCEGLVGLLNTPFFDGALPDCMFTPCGFPLMIAMAVRFACKAEWWELSNGCLTDVIAAKEFNSQFESNWGDCQKKHKSRRIYAIDIALQAAWRDAKDQAEKLGAKRACYDNLIFWQRAGQRCLNVLFSVAEDLKARPSSRYGQESQTADPVEEAARAVLRKKLGMPNPSIGLKGAWQNQRLSDRRRKLFEIVDSVEEWLRTGRFRKQQISVPNTQTVQKEACRREVEKQTRELKRVIEAHIEESVKEMIENGEFKDEAQARATAKVFHETANEHMDDVVKTQTKMEEFEKELLGSQEEGEDHQPADVNIHAMSTATSCLAAGLCQGAMVHHQFGLASFLVSEESLDTCADCTNKVHVLEGTFLTSQYGKCLRCFRHRCEACQKKKFEYFQKNPAAGSATQGCRWCQPKKKARK